MLTVKNEFDLHVAIVKFIREKYPEAVIVPGLGEFQDTDDLRIKSWQKVYSFGQPDLLILNLRPTTTVLPLSFNTPRVQNHDRHPRRMVEDLEADELEDPGVPQPLRDSVPVCEVL